MDDRSAGIVLFRRPAGSGVIEYCLLRNARHKTWGIAKGHLEDGESDMQAAEREVEEETGLLRDQYVLVDGFAHEMSYPIHIRGRPVTKTVRTFLAEAATDAEVRLSPEHDGLSWLPLNESLRVVVFENLRALLREVAGAIDDPLARK